MLSEWFSFIIIVVVNQSFDYSIASIQFQLQILFWHLAQDLIKGEPPVFGAVVKEKG
jgi:hypothetical protein